MRIKIRREVKEVRVGRGVVVGEMEGKPCMCG